MVDQQMNIQSIQDSIVEPMMSDSDNLTYTRNIAPIDPLPNVSLVPAAMSFPNHGGMGIYIKWKGHGRPSGTEVISASAWNHHLLLPDREIYIVGNLNKQDTGRNEIGVSMGPWDEFIPLSIFHESQTNVVGRGPRSFMVNAEQTARSDRKFRTAHNTRIKRRPGMRKIFGDSGGFQLKNNPNTFIDPVTVAEYYNANVDSGIVLDFPLLDQWNWENLIAAAEIQKTNIEVMQSILRPEVRLINVAHGMEVQSRLDFLDIVHNPTIHSIAVSNSNYEAGIIAFIHDIKIFHDGIVSKYGQHYNHLHILGMADNKLFIPMMRMIAKGLLQSWPEITMDASTHVHASASKIYFHYSHSTHNAQNLKIGDDGNFPNPEMRLPCSCHVCSTIGWMDAMNILATNSGVTFLLMYHNIFNMDAYFRTMLWYCTHLSTKDLLSMLKSVFRGNKNVLVEVAQAIRYVDAIVEDGFEKASGKYGFYVHHSKDHEIITTESLFGHIVVDTENLDMSAYGDTLRDEYGNDKPKHLLDAERIETYKLRLEGLKRRIRVNKERQFTTSAVPARKRPPKRKDDKIKKALPITIVEGDNKPVILVPDVSDTESAQPKVIKFKRPKKKHRKIEVADYSKSISNVTSRTGPSLKKHKQKIKLRKSTKGKILGKQVRKSKNSKRL